MSYTMPPKWGTDQSLGVRGGSLPRAELERRFRELQQEYLLMLKSKVRISHDGVDIYCDTIEEAERFLEKLKGVA